MPPSNTQIFAAAVQCHQAGRLPEAEKLYRQVLTQDPDNADVLHRLGTVLHDTGRLNDAAAAFVGAISLAPGCADYYFGLGNVRKDQNRGEEAIAEFRRALALKSDYPQVYNNLGTTLLKAGRIEEAVAALRAGLVHGPHLAQLHYNLGNALSQAGRHGEATAALARAADLNPQWADAHFCLGNTLKDQQRYEEAIRAYRQAVRLNPKFADAYSNLGNCLRILRRCGEASNVLQLALGVSPNHVPAITNLGVVHLDQGQVKEAIAAFRRAVALQPDFAEAYVNLANALRGMGQLEESLTAARKAVVSNPHLANAYNALGNALGDTGESSEAIAAYRRAMAIQPDFHQAYSNLLYLLQYVPGVDAAAIRQEHEHWYQQHARPLEHFIEPHRNDRIPNRRLRIGYVSPDFCDHCQSLFTIPLLSHHDREQFEVFCYSSTLRTDHVTRRIAALPHAYRTVAECSDEQLADLIRKDQIDILVDLTMHMANNRMLLFARKPAPVQMSWLAYPGTTGLKTIDIRFTDPHLDPSGHFDGDYCERSIRLPHTFWCYDPLITNLAANPLPAMAGSHITFGCLNNPNKLNAGVYALWCRVLRAVPNSRLLIYAHAGSHRLKILESLGVSADRVEFVPRQARMAYFETFHRIDISLDTFPYNGHTSSLDSFWMGVPVVTLVGETIVGRAGVCQLMNLGLPELIARSQEQYVEIAAGLASDLPRLAQLRATLRERMEGSPLMDAKSFARDVEGAYRAAWQAWCGEK